MKIKSWQPYLWSVLYVLLLYSFFTSFNIITINLVMVPAIVLFMKLDARRFVFFYAAVMAVLLIIDVNAGLVLMIVALFFLPPVIAMGYYYKKRNARTAVIAGILALLAEFLLMLAISYAIGGNPISSLESYVDDMILTLPPVARELIPSNFTTLIVKIIPLFMVSFAVYYIIISHAITRWIMRRSNETLPALPPLRNWKLPRSMVWYLLIAVVLEFTVDPGADTTMSMIAVNLAPLLTAAFAVQAVSLFAYIGHIKGWGRALPIVSVIVMILISPAIYLFCLVGLLDVVFPLREKIAKKS
ncbi:MAG: DUF2232 domain-containing protein [Paenibacillaceae bacterium]|uniref:DUF2232 domain-containing protein n=1 Tax=Paenibacillus cymbidii TaxID=1639034 RepID=UPI0010818636|nr:DUF2232 domain-containing protein [Paenibacillus cymbidii]MBO9608810.1 DUF2232 domain-containing protein [Paenibacillaceae bacterium]